MVSLQKLRNKKVLVFGLGISGIATLKSLIKNKSIVSVWDDNKKKFRIKKFTTTLIFIVNNMIIL